MDAFHKSPDICANLRDKDMSYDLVHGQQILESGKVITSCIYKVYYHGRPGRGKDQ